MSQTPPVAGKKVNPGPETNTAGAAITILGLIMGLSFVLGSIKQMVKLRQVRQEHAQALAQKEKVFKEREFLKKRVAALHDPKVLEKEAREKLGLVKRNEIPIHIVKDEAPKILSPKVPGVLPPPGAKKKKEKEEKKSLWQKALEFFE